MIAGKRHPALIDAGLAAETCGQCWEVEPGELHQFVKPRLSQAQQNNQYKYIAVADGNCISGRLMDMLSSDSATFWVQSFQEEWYYGLLVPMRHYIPVQYAPNVWPLEGGINLAEMVTWAEQHPDTVAHIVQEAKAFARLHLSPRGQTCFLVRLLQAYHELLTGLERLEALVQEAEAAWAALIAIPTPPPAPASPAHSGLVHTVHKHIRRFISA